jgi:hypothetical protein
VYGEGIDVQVSQLRGVGRGKAGSAIAASRIASSSFWRWRQSNHHDTGLQTELSGECFVIFSRGVGSAAAEELLAW